MSKQYRKFAVEQAVFDWEQTDNWFSADALLPRAIKALPQSHMHMNVYAVAKALRILESKGALEGRRKNGIKEYKRAGVWDGRSHFHA